MTNKELIKIISQAVKRKDIWLDLSDKQLTSCPPEIGQLRALYLSNNRLTALPPEIEQLTTLIRLNVNNNKLAELPPQIGRLTNLTHLDLSNNLLTTLPKEIGQLTSLTQFELSGNQLTTLPPEISLLTKLTKLYLANNHLTQLPPRLGRLANLIELDLANNQLTTLFPEPKEMTITSWFWFLTSKIEPLPSLILLNLNRNQLTELPLEITKFIRLKRVDLANNRLIKLLPEIGQLTFLTELDLRHNRLIELPAKIGQLPHLEKLYLNHNHLIGLPAEIGQLTKLHELYLNDNQLTELPPEISQLTHLSKLYAFGNRLIALPPKLQQLTNLTTLDLRSNLLPIIPEILEQTNQPAEIINYYELQQQAEKRPLNEAKMLLVGLGSVGKTSLVKRLLYNTFDENEPITDGINIKPWDITVRHSQIRLNVWDFGGQEIMHATHQFFFTKRSLYLLVLDARHGEQEHNIEYWLKLMQSFGGDSPIIIVINKIDAYSLNINELGLQTKYRTIKGFVKISCKTGEGLEILSQTIMQEIDKLPHIHDDLLLSWFAIKTQLDKMEQNYIPYSEYQRLCQAQNILREIDQQTLIRLLHDLGVVLSFQDDHRLRDTNILKPDWVTSGVYQILNSPLLFQSKGILSFGQLESILDPQIYPPRQHQFIMEMMRKFELCFDFNNQPDHGRRFLIPDLLQVEEPYLNWNQRRSLVFQYHYNVLPGSVISRFIVRIQTVFELKTYWRNGVVVADKQNQALVKADKEERKIVISILGTKRSRRHLLTTIRAHFDHIHATIPKLEVKAVVSLPGQPEFTIDYDDLLQIEAEGIPKYYHAKSKRWLNIRELLEGVKPLEHFLPSDEDSDLVSRLDKAFPTIDDLCFFCYDSSHFLPLYNRWRPPFNKMDMLEQLITYAIENKQLDLLLDICDKYSLYDNYFGSKTLYIRSQE